MIHYRGHRIDFSNIDKDSVIVDAGMCLGDFSKFIKRHNIGCKQFGIEACVRNFEKLNNLKLNGKIINKALVGNMTHEKTIKFNDYQGYNGRGSIFDKHLDDRYPKFTKINTYEIPTISVDELFSEFDIKVIDYLKLDVEGAEHGIFDDFPINVLQFSAEIHQIPNNELTTDILAYDLKSKLESLGYSCQYFPEHTELWGMKNE